MDRYSLLFDRLGARNEGAFVPFVTIGDPNPTLSLQIIDTLVESGADTIQGATIRALAAGTTPPVCFELLKQIRLKYPELPIGPR